MTNPMVHSAPARPTAIIVGTEPRIVVTIARSLHRHQVRCVVVEPRDHKLPVSSRAIASVLTLDGDLADSAALLTMIAKAEHAAWVVPASDIALNVVCEAYHDLVRVCAVGCPRPEIVQRVLDKSQTLAAAKRCGVPVPESVKINSASEIGPALANLRFPIIAKPGNKAASPRHSFKTRTFHSEHELRQAFARAPRFGEGLLFQRFQSGHGVGVEVLLHNGEPVAHFQHRRLSELPPSGGVAVVATAEPSDPVLLDHAVRLLRELEWEGIAMVEFRQDPITGQAALMEVNGRFWGSIALAVAAGVDFPLQAWQIARGLTPVVSSRPYRIGMRVRWTAGALRRVEHVYNHGRELGIPMSRAVRQLAIDFRPGNRSALWAWSDPVPAIQDVVRVLGRWTRHAAKSAATVVLPHPVIDTVKSSRNLPSDRQAAYIRRKLGRSLRPERVNLPVDVQSVLFVCHGNIMRSAAAGQFLRDALAAAGVTDVRVESAGTTARHGRPADPRVQAAALRLGTDLDEHRSQPLTDELVEAADAIFAMDDLNFVNIVTAFPQARGKVMLLGGMTPVGKYAAHEIVDPYTATEDDVCRTVTLIHGYVSALSEAIMARRSREPAYP